MATGGTYRAPFLGFHGSHNGRWQVGVHRPVNGKANEGLLLFPLAAHVHAIHRAVAHSVRIFWLIPDMSYRIGKYV